ISTENAERATKAYVVRGDSTARSTLQAAQSIVEDALDELARSSEDNPRQRELLNRLSPVVASSFSEFRATVAIRDHASADSARRFFSREIAAHEADSLVKIVGLMRDEELRVLAERARVQSTTGETARRVILLGTVLAFLLAMVALQPMRAAVAARLTSHLTPGEVAAASAGAAHLQALHRLVAALAAVHEPAAGARALVDAGATSFRATLAAVIVPNGAGGFSVLHATDTAFSTVSPDLAAAVAEALRKGTLVTAASRAARERQFGTLAGLDGCGASGAVCFVPLSRDAIATGVLFLAFAGDRTLDGDELSLAATLGRLGAAAVASHSLNA
ncbi:MAG: CHASE3 domain-containing protein, partial [Gemmatimonadetes bacterium]|nr:CHASE3 domain-containing protein [Gemmatimonadota bacterium]